MKVLRRWKDKEGRIRVAYEAGLMDNGRRVTQRCETVFINGRPLNEAPSVSYYAELLKLA